MMTAGDAEGGTRGWGAGLQQTPVAGEEGGKCWDDKDEEVQAEGCSLFVGYPPVMGVAGAEGEDSVTPEEFQSSGVADLPLDLGSDRGTSYSSVEDKESECAETGHGILGSNTFTILGSEGDEFGEDREAGCEEECMEGSLARVATEEEREESQETLRVTPSPTTIRPLSPDLPSDLDLDKTYDVPAEAVISRSPAASLNPAAHCGVGRGSPEDDDMVLTASLEESSAPGRLDFEAAAAGEDSVVIPRYSGLSLVNNTSEGAAVGLDGGAGFPPHDYGLGIDPVISAADLHTHSVSHQGIQAVLQRGSADTNQEWGLNASLGKGGEQLVSEDSAITLGLEGESSQGLMSL